MMENKYFNEALIGNENVLATFTSKGEIQRLYFPSRDNRQLVDFYHTGIKVNDSNLIYLHDDVNNLYKQYYEPDTNILNTEIINTYFNIKILQTDFVTTKDNVLMKKYLFINESKIDLDVKFYIHSSLLTDHNDIVGSKIVDGGMIQYAHDFSLSTVAKSKKTLSHQLNGSRETIKSGEIKDKDYIGMANDSSVCYEVGTISPREKKEIEIYLLIDENKNVSDMEKEINRIRKKDYAREYSNAKSYWRKYVKAHNGLDIKELKDAYDERIYEIYKRSILLFPLLTNEETGGFIASPEVDENRTKCGMYAFCWPRDAVFVARALDILKMHDEAEKFYKVFCKKTQSKNGMWEQRFYTDGRLAPCWGYQVDETASVVYGVYEHYKYTKSTKFLKETLPMCERAVKFLKDYIRDWLDISVTADNKKDVVKEELENRYKREGHKFPISYDLWEMCEGIHLYSIASIYGAFDSLIRIYEALGDNTSNFENNRLKQEKVAKNSQELEKLMVRLKKYINFNLYDEEKKSYVRNTEDKKMDISILGSVVPFGVFRPKEKKMLNTVERINLSLRTYTGGYKRFEDDNYMNGNPWVISNLWMTLYYLKAGDKKRAKETFDFVVNTCGKHNMLGEQIDNNTLKPNWVLGLGWSHAMFIIALEQLFK